MLDKHPSAEQAQIYFGITEPVKKAASSFFKYLENDIEHIYKVSIYQALKDHYDVSHLQNDHIEHIKNLLIGEIHEGFMQQSSNLWGSFHKLGVTIGEYIKLYQLLMSYFSAEAHKKYWFRYGKYRELNRSIRNLMLFDLAVGTSGPTAPTLRFVSDDEDFSTLSFDVTHPQNNWPTTNDIAKKIQELTLRSAFLAEQIEASVSGKIDTINLDDCTKELLSVAGKLKELNNNLEQTATADNNLSEEVL